MQKNIEVSIITVGMNHIKHLNNYLHSLYIVCYPKVSFELIYVDNCSVDDSVNFIRENYPEVRIIVNNSIEGFAFNNNLGVKNSIGKYILILNPDIILLPNAIDKLYQYLTMHESIGIMLPKLLNIDYSVQLSLRRFMNFKIMFYRLIHKGRDNVKATVLEDYLMLTDFDRDKIQAVDWGIGAAMLMTKKWFDELKGFDEGYFLYVEDVDICLRSWKLGKPVVYFPDAVFIHAHQRMSSKGWSKKKIMHLKSMARFFLKHNILVKSYNYQHEL